MCRGPGTADGQGFTPLLRRSAGFAGYHRPPDGLGVGEDPGLDGFVISGRGQG